MVRIGSLKVGTKVKINGRLCKITGIEDNYIIVDKGTAWYPSKMVEVVR